MILTLRHLRPREISGKTRDEIGRTSNNKERPVPAAPFAVLAKVEVDVDKLVKTD